MLTLSDQNRKDDPVFPLRIAAAPCGHALARRTAIETFGNSV
jgi:hypothetical protein